jgi:LysM repeat protein
MRKPAIALFLALSLAVSSSACLFGGSKNPASVGRPSSIPTATPPSKLPDPILVGETQATSAQPSASTSSESTYVVKSGDTLGSIAASLGIDPAQQATWIQQVLQLNGIPDATLLQAGVALTLPRLPTPRPGTPSAAATSAARTSTPGAQPTVAPTARPTTAAVTGGGGTYTVVSGDFPLLIAQKVGVPDAAASAWVNQLVALNNIDPSNLQVGAVLQLPPIPTPVR